MIADLIIIMKQLNDNLSKNNTMERHEFSSISRIYLKGPNENEGIVFKFSSLVILHRAGLKTVIKPDIRPYELIDSSAHTRKKINSISKLIEGPDMDFDTEQTG